MNPKLGGVLRAVTPPIILNVAKSLFSSKGTGEALQEQGEKGPDWYDGSFEENARWKSHYTQSGYYFLWTVILDRMKRSGIRSILEIGCGAGQLACYISDMKVYNYHGFDFSPKRISQAQSVCPEFSFITEDAFKTRLFERSDYDCVVCTEFLEHVEADIEVLGRIKSGTRFYGTVPNFPFISHVRHFENQTQVMNRYESCFQELMVDAIPANDRGKTFFLIEGKIA